MLTYVGIAGVTAVAAGAQAISGFGFSLIAVPLVALLAGPKAAVVGTAIIGPVLTWGIMLRERGNVRWTTAAIVCLAALAGMPVGLYVLSRVGDRGLLMVIGIAVLLIALALWRGLSVPAARGTEVAAGALSGALATSTGTNGPPLVIAFHAADMSPSEFRGTLSASFAAQGLVALAGFGLTGHLTADAGKVAAAALPGLALGWLVGERVFTRTGADRFRSVVLLMLAASGAASLVGALAGA
jgi:uncharacterized membrane protein YfcA